MNEYVIVYLVGQNDGSMDIKNTTITNDKMDSEAFSELRDFLCKKHTNVPKDSFVIINIIKLGEDEKCLCKISDENKSAHTLTINKECPIHGKVIKEKK